MIAITNRGIEIDDNGYLEEYELNNKLIFSLSAFFLDAVELNKNLNVLIEDLKAPRGDGLATFYLGTLERIHKDYQAIMILLSRGLQSQARSVTRNLLEKTFMIKAVNNDSKNLELWVKTQNRERNRTIRIIKEGHTALSEEEINELDLEESEDTEQVRFSDWAVRAGMVFDYYVIYNILCGDTHHTMSGMDRDVYTEDGEFAGFAIGPDFENLDYLITLVMHYMLKAAAIVANYLSVKADWIVMYQNKLDKVDEMLHSKISG